MGECKFTACRNNCCRVYHGREFCGVESSCLESSSWAIALVPSLLGLSAIILFIVMMVVLNSKQRPHDYQQLRHNGEKKEEPNLRNAHESKQETERNLMIH